MNNGEEYEKNDLFIKKKEYELEENANRYKLNITLKIIYIDFKLTPINDIIFIYYINKYDLNSINNKLSLSHNMYNNLEKVMKLIDDCYINNKLSLKIDINNEINLALKYPIGYKEYESSITLMKEKFDINEKFEIIDKRIWNFYNK